jgi:hypothetical protein
MAQEQTFTVYGVFRTEEEIEQDKYDIENGIVRYHETTYIESRVPIELEDELSAFIEKRIAEFENKCNCEDCKNNRKIK